MDEKKRRAFEEARKRSLHGLITKIYVSVGFCAETAAFLKWCEETPSFPAMLRRFAAEHLGELEDGSLWDNGISQILTDLAMREMTQREKAKRDIFLPRDLVRWFADFLERTFPKPFMRWDSPLFSQEAVQPVLNDLTRERSHVTSEPDVASS